MRFLVFCFLYFCFLLSLQMLLGKDKWFACRLFVYGMGVLFVVLLVAFLYEL